MRTLHTCIRVMDLEKSIDFYEKALGFQVTEKRDYPEDEFSLVYLALPGEDLELELTYNYDRQEPYDLGTGYGHMAFGTQRKLEEVHAEMKAKGLEVQDILGLSDGAAKFFFITDPDGYQIEIIQE